MTNYDVLVLGGGLSGLVAASELKERGFNPLVLEGGKSQKKIKTHPASLVSQINLKKWDHVLNLGGRSLLWGGWIGPEYKEEKLYRKLKVKKLNISPQLRKNKFCAKHQVDKNLVSRLKKNIKIKTNQLVTKLVIENGEVYGVYCQKKFYPSKKVVICLSPVETVRLLFNSSYKDPGLGKGFINHGLLGFVVLLKKSQALKLKNESAYMKKKWGIIEYRGEFPAREFDKTLGDYVYARIHSIIELPASSKKYLYLNHQKKLSLAYDISAVDKKIYETALNDTMNVINKLLPEHEAIISLHDENEFSIAHETGGCTQVTHQDGRLKKVRGVWIADASVLKRTYATYPTYNILRSTKAICAQVD